jgi:hypothetical protein
MRIVLDTNVLISGTFWKGDSHKILILIAGGVLTSITSQDIIDEYRKVLARDDIVDKVVDKNLVASKIAQGVIDVSVFVKSNLKLNIVQDPTDNKIVECALVGNADYIITNDFHLLELKTYNTIKIITPKDFLKLLEK